MDMFWNKVREQVIFWRIAWAVKRASEWDLNIQ